MKLYELSQGWQKLMDAIAEADGEISPELEAELSALESDISRKTENTAKIIKSLEAEADAFTAESRRMAQRAKALENKSAWLKSYLLNGLKSVGLDKVKGELLTVAIRRNPPSVIVAEGAEDGLIQHGYGSIEMVKKIDKKSIIDAWKETGEAPDGVEIVQGERIDIR